MGRLQASFFEAFFTNSKGEGKIDQIRFGFKTDGSTYRPTMEIF